MEQKPKKDRSPQFPFIPLSKAIERAREFETQYTTHEARIAGAVKTWGYAEKSSGGIQTIAALCGYGLMDDNGSGPDRKLKISDLGRRILKEARPDQRQEAVKKAALKPKIIAEFWAIWGISRPPDHECVSTLHLDRGFKEEAARKFLSVYDGTIKFAGLSKSDNITDDSETGKDIPPAPEGDKSRLKPPPKPKVDLMAGERVVFAQELSPAQSFRFVVSGEVDDFMIDALVSGATAFAEFQKKILARRTTEDEGNEPAKDQ